MRALNDMLYQENKKMLTEKTLLSAKLAAAGAIILTIMLWLNDTSYQYSD